MSPTTLSEKRPIRFRFKALTNRERSDFDDLKETLQQALQVAIALEFSTIPPYLTALYSLKDKTSEAYRVIRSVALEEMLHINLACNLLNAIADETDIKTRPKFHGEIDISKLVPNNTPDEDTKIPLPIAYPDTLLRPIFNGPRVQLMAASTDLMSQTFMAIEQPEPETNKEIGLGQEFDTIGQFYAAIEQLFIQLAGLDTTHNQLFTGKQDWQRNDFYFGSGGGKPINILDAGDAGDDEIKEQRLENAKLAIRQIMVQGEGANPPVINYTPQQEYGTYNHYGLRSDGTYGPILGTPYELSHYFKFKAIAEGIIPLPSVYPMLPNPSYKTFQTKDAKCLVILFNLSYTILVLSLQRIFRNDKKLYFGVVVDLMQNLFPLLATQLMQTPAVEGADAILGPTAGPSFEFPPFLYLHSSSELETQDISSILAGDIDTWINKTDLEIQDILSTLSSNIDTWTSETDLSSSTVATVKAVKATLEDIQSKCASTS